MSESVTGKELEDSQHLFNTTSTTIQHPLNVGLIENAQTPDTETETKPQEFIQQTTKEEGERVGVEQGQSQSILQAASSTRKKDNSEVAQTQRLSKGWNKRNPFQVGDLLLMS